MKNIKLAILEILSPRTIGMYPDTLKSEVAINLRNHALTTREYDTALAELKSMGYVQGMTDCMGELAYIVTDAGRAALVASGKGL